MLQPMIAWIIFGGDEGIRTPGLLHAKQALSQLSHTPIEDCILFYRITVFLSITKPISYYFPT